jgi:hypothetical protein
MTKIEITLQYGYEHGDIQSRGNMIAMSKLGSKLQNDCQLAYRLLEQMYAEANFVPLVVTGMASLGRINACAELLMEELEKVPFKLRVQ